MKLKNVEELNLRVINTKAEIFDIFRLELVYLQKLKQTQISTTISLTIKTVIRLMNNIFDAALHSS